MAAVFSPSKLKRAPSVSAMHLRPYAELKRSKRELRCPTPNRQLAEEFQSCINNLVSTNVFDALKLLRGKSGDVKRQAAAMELSLTALRSSLEVDNIDDESLNFPFDPPLVLMELPVETSACLTRLESLRKLLTNAPPTTDASPIQLSACGELGDLRKKSTVPISLRPNYKAGPSINTLDVAFCQFSAIVTSVPTEEMKRTADYIDAQRVARILQNLMGEVYNSNDSNHFAGPQSGFVGLSTSLVPRPLNFIYVPSNFGVADTNKRRVALMYALDGFLPLRWSIDAPILSSHEDIVFKDDRSHQWNKDILVVPDRESSRFDIIFSDDRSHYLAVRVDVEAPGDVDPDLQLSCMYDLFRRSFPQPILPGCPMFLMTVVGPRIAIFGAIYDGASTIIEPLVSCMAIRDPFLLLAAPLTQAFYALKQGVVNLQNRSKLENSVLSKAKLVPGCPVIFSRFVLEVPGRQNREFNVEYLRPFKLRNCQSSHIFEAVQEGSGALVLVKFPILNKYGRSVHIKLAGLGFAPKLLGWCTTPVGTAYASEYLKKPTKAEGGWFTLFELAIVCKSEAQRLRTAIRNRLNDILETLQKNNMVHGDIRSNNVMIKMKNVLHIDDEQGLIMLLVDFDWADDELSAYYPAVLNMDIPWSGKPGLQILFQHDSEMVDRWFAKYPTSITF